MNKVDLKKIEREQARWLILDTLNSARPVGANEEIILGAINAVPLPMTLIELRRELDYLEERGLIEIAGRDRPVWFAKLTRYGVDIVQYTIGVDPGIARPSKWW